MSHHVSHDALAQLLIRIQGKIETRTRRPWFDLQRSYYFVDRAGCIKTVAELKAALEHFHVILSEAEYAQLFAAFPLAPQGSQGQGQRFDFKAFAEKMYSRADKPPAAKTVDGRIVATLFGSEGAEAQQQQQDQQQQQPPRTPQQQPRFDGSGSMPQTLSPQQQAIYEQRGYYADDGQQLQRPIIYDDQPPQQQQGFSPNGTQQQYGSPSNGRGSRASQGRGSRSRSRSPFKPRITYNRPAHARYVQSSFESAHPDPQPHPAPYPSQELFGAGSKPRFEQKPQEPLVDVARRHNISAQARRTEGAASPQKNGARR